MVIDIAPEETHSASSGSNELSWVEGDASEHLDELVVDPTLLAATSRQLEGNLVSVELVGPHLRLRGKIVIGSFQRLSDFLNHHRDGLVTLSDATVLRRNGDPTRVQVPSIWTSLSDVTLVAELAVEPKVAAPDFFRAKDRAPLLVVTPGHTMTGEIHLIPGGELALFVESADPQFLPMTDVRTRSLADRRVTERYAFALLNRQHIVATAALPPGMAAGRTVL